MNIGKNTKLDLQEVIQAVKIRAFEVSKSRGALSKDFDFMDYMNRAEVHFEIATISIIEGTPSYALQSAYVTLAE
jgi:hypothetical protein